MVREQGTGYREQGTGNREQGTQEERRSLVWLRDASYQKSNIIPI
ncbi:hypothetical protein PN480_14765 [Dolichospermum circinale CS-1225]|nr:hypothetical protein [Dolichospermum circinale]MDB9523195.1 hypothetical protein [Dolichospermum circinale CS-1225]